MFWLLGFILGVLAVVLILLLLLLASVCELTDIVLDHRED